METKVLIPVFEFCLEMSGVGENKDSKDIVYCAD